MRPVVLEQQEFETVMHSTKEATRELERKYPLANKVFNAKDFAVKALIQCGYLHKGGNLWAKNSTRATLDEIISGIEHKYTIERKPTGRYTITFWEV
jgi:hypothetical protein